MNFDLASILPSTSLVPFNCYRLANPGVLWENTSLATQSEAFLDYFCKPLEGESREAYTDESLTFHAERYGGNGVGYNGGGARCGLRGQFQVKGIGRTPVVGLKSDYWHSHGAASLLEGIREALWGEVCHLALPYGGARVFKLILTGTTCPYDHAQIGPTTAERVLIVREPVLRPSHYMRSIDHIPIEEARTSWVSDAKRTRNAIGVIHRAFECYFGITGASRIQVINEGLIAMCVRMAAQLSAARVKRIMHGSFSCSNIGMDGSFVDYGTITTLSDYGRIIVARRNPDLWEQALPLYETFKELLFYLKKYLPEKDAGALVPADILINTFAFQLQRSMAYEFVKLVGIPNRGLRDIDFSRVLSLHECFTDIIAAGNAEPFKLAPEYVSTMPDVMGTYHLNTLIHRTAPCDDLQSMSEAIRQDLRNEALRDRFCRVIWDVRESFLAHMSQENGARARLLVMFNALRLNVPFKELYRPDLDRQLQRLMHHREDIGDFIQKIKSKTATFLADSSDGEVNISSLLSVVSPVGDGMLRVFNNPSFPHEVVRAVENIDVSLLSGEEDRIRAYAAKQLENIH